MVFSKKAWGLFLVLGCVAQMMCAGPVWSQLQEALGEQEYSDRAFVAYTQGDYDQAIVYLTKILEGNPEASYAANARASAYAKKLGFEKALAEYGRGIEVTPEGVVIKYIGDYGQSIGLEYIYLSMKYGIRGMDWDLERQKLIEEGGRKYDEMAVKVLATGEQKTLRFDITEPFAVLEQQTSGQ